MSPFLGLFSPPLARMPSNENEYLVGHMKAYHEFEIDYFQDEDGFFTARVAAIPGCIASGKTLSEAYRNAVDAIESCLEARRKMGAMKLRKPRYRGLNVYRHPVHA